MATANSIYSDIPIEISKGGTNATSMTVSFGVIYFDSSSLVTVASVGTAGYALTSNGAGAAPSFQSYSDSSGANTSSVSAYRSTNLSVNDATTAAVPCDTEIFDTASNYNAGSGVFTAPTTGYYLATISGIWEGTTTRPSFFLSSNGLPTVGAGFWDLASACQVNDAAAPYYTYAGGSSSSIMKLTASDTLQLSARHDADAGAAKNVIAGQQVTRFGVSLLG